MANLKNKMSKGNCDLNYKVPCKTKLTSLHFQKRKELRFLPAEFTHSTTVY